MADVAKHRLDRGEASAIQRPPAFQAPPEEPDLPEEDTAQLAPPVIPSEAVSVSIRMLATTMVTVRSDGETVFSGMLAAGEEKSFSARENLAVASDDGRAVTVRSGSLPEEPLSEADGPFEAIFGREGRLTVQ